MGGYAELAVTSNFTFLTGASHPEELVRCAHALGHTAAAIADTNTLAGIVRAHGAAKEVGVPLAVGCRVVVRRDGEMERRRDEVGELPGSPGGLTPSLSVLAFPTTRPAYANLCRLLTRGKRRAPKGECYLSLDDLCEFGEGLLAVVMPPGEIGSGFVESLARVRGEFGDRASLAGTCSYGPDDARRLRELADLAAAARVPLVAVNDARYHTPQRRLLQDVVTCIRHGCTIEEAGFRLAANAERHLKPPDEMARLFGAYPGAVERSVEIAARASAFSLDELRYEYPSETCPAGMSAGEYLADRTWAGGAKRYPGGVPGKVAEQIRYELALIAELRYEAYFLTCYDIVEFARSRGIFCQGRGGAANSAVCYCLGITEVDPAVFSLLFERFVSRERGEPPDIDIDFEHERREEVIQYLYEKYGRDRAALTAEVISYRGRSAVREVGKAMGLSLDCVDAMAKNISGWGEAMSDERVREMGFDPTDKTIRQVIELTSELRGFPRHLSQHVGGFVITQRPLDELVPIENAAMEDRTVIEWDKDDIDAMGMLKVDCLGLGMLTCIGKVLRMVYPEEPEPYPRHVELARDLCDPEVYEMVCHADTIGVFQIESRAQMSMLPRLKPRHFYDLVIEVAIVRPGPIQGNMVHPYLRRRNGEDPVTYPNAAIEAVLSRTLGVPLFQEQAMRLAIVAAGFTPDEADKLRRAMAAWKRKGDAIFRFGEKLIDGMLANGYPREFAERCFEQIKGFSEYGFPESHAASFAILVYVSAWLKRYKPAAFAAALINSQPMGFYRPAQIIGDAREHGVEVLPVDVNRGGWDCVLERDGGTGARRHEGAEARRHGGAETGAQARVGREGETERRRDGVGEMGEVREVWGSGGPAIRLGMRLVKGLRRDDADRIAAAVAERGAFATVEALWRASGVSAAALKKLAQADAFGSMGLDRQAALWQIRPLRDDRLPLFEQTDGTDETGLDLLPRVKPGRRVLQDYESTGLSLKAHPVSFVRRGLAELGAITTAELRSEAACPTGRRVQVAGLVLVRQRPGTASGVVFITLEDETGIANLILWPKTFERFRRVARLSRVLLASGRVERQGEVVHVHVERLESLDGEVPMGVRGSRDFH